MKKQFLKISIFLISSFFLAPGSFADITSSDDNYLIHDIRGGLGLSVDELIQQSHAKSIYALDLVWRGEVLLTSPASNEVPAVLSSGFQLDTNIGSRGVNTMEGSGHVGGGIALYNENGQLIGIVLDAQFALQYQNSAVLQQGLIRKSLGAGPQLVFIDKSTMARLGIDVLQGNANNSYDGKYTDNVGGPAILAEFSHAIADGIVVLLKGKIDTDLDGNLVEAKGSADLQVQLKDDLWLTLGGSYDRNSVGDNDARLAVSLDYKYGSKK